MATKKLDQKGEVLKYLQEHTKGITAQMAWQRFGIQRLAHIIYELRNEGYSIATVKKAGRTRYGANVTYAVYMLVGGEKE
jgi:hypothetical protein